MKKRKKWRILLHLISLVAVLVLAIGVSVPGASAATPDEINQAIEDGLAWLAANQNANGSWGWSWPTVGNTGLAVLKFETHATFMGLSPFDPSYPYHTNVENGLDFIFNNCYNINITPQPAGDPDSNGNGIGVAAYTWYSGYETGIALMAICASTEPGRIVGVGSQAGRSFLDVATDMVDVLAWGQSDGGNTRGGWRYDLNSQDADNSVTGYCTLGLSYAESPAPWGFGIPIPPWVLTELNIFIGNVQDPVDGDADDGGSWYVPLSWSWINILKTGNLLSEMAIVGDSQATPRVQDAVDYIERHWNDANSDPGWRNDYQTCFTSMKGFQALGIDTIDVGGPVSWYDEMSTMIVATQNADGSWPNDNHGDSPLTTTWAMLTLEKAAPPALSLLPPFDVNPPGSDHTVTAVYKVGGVPQAGVQINFEVIAGPNAGESGSAITDANGEATFTYTGAGGNGTDTIRATAVDGTGTPLISSQAQKEWKDGTPPQEVPGVTGWGMIAAALIIAALIPLGLRRRQQTNKAR